MRGFKRLAELLVFAVVALSFDGASRAATLPYTKDIICDVDTLGTLSITEYHADNPGRFGPGATLVAQFVQADPNCDLHLAWIQAIVGGAGTIGESLGGPGTIPYLDPYKRDDDLPFYWKTDENETVGTGKLNATANPGTLFSDTPSQGPTPGVNGNSIHFETALVAISCTDPLDLYWLGGFTWGYSISNPAVGNGTSTIDAFSWIAAPSAAMTTAVTNFDGTDNYVGDGDTLVNNDTGPKGYNFIPGCPECCPVPLPASGWMGLVALGAAGVMFGKKVKIRTSSINSLVG